MSAETATPASTPPKVPIRSPGSKIARIALGAIALVLLAWGGYYAWHTWVSPDNSRGALLTAVATRGDLEDTVTATGTLQPKEYVDVGTQVSGQIKRLLVDVGAIVKSGDLLAEIDPSVYQSKVDADQAQIANQQALANDRQAQLALAKLQFTRQQNMAADEATSTEAVQTAEATLKSATAQVAQVKAQLQQTESTLRGDQANLGYTKIHAPMAGTVVSLAAKQGQTLNANQQAPIVLRIADLTTMTVEAQVSEADVSKLRLGMDVYFTTLGGDTRRHYGKLRQIPPTPTVVNNVVLYDALFDVENPDQTLMTQMTAQVFFIVDSAKDAVLVPIAALRPVPRRERAPGSTPGSPAEGERGERRRGEGSRGERTRGDGSASGASPGPRPSGARAGGPRAGGADMRTLSKGGHALVSVMDPDGKVTDREVTIGAMNRISAQITSGLEPGEKVVIGTSTPNAPAASPQAGSALTGNAPRGGGRR